MLVRSSLIVACASLVGCANYTSDGRVPDAGFDASVVSDATTESDAQAEPVCGKTQVYCKPNCIDCDVQGAIDTSRLSFTCGEQGACVVGCASPYSACQVSGNSRCLDLKSDSYHCGSCERACGSGTNDPGTCNQGQCVAKAVTSLGDTTGSFLLHSTGKMYFHDKKSVYRCDLPECTNREALYSGTFEALPLPQGLVIAPAAGVTHIYFLGKQSGSTTTSLARCPILGTCTEPEIYVANMPSVALFGSSDGLFTFDGAKLFSIALVSNPASATRFEIAKYKWVPTRFTFTADGIFDASIENGVHRSPRTACSNPDTNPCSPDSFVDPSRARPTTIEAKGEVLYFNDSVTGGIYSCPPSGCANPITQVVSTQLGTESLHTDGFGLAWTYRSANGLADEVRMCTPSGGACAASKVFTVAAQQRNATQVRLGTKSALYWLSTGADDSDAGTTAAIRRTFAPNGK